MQSFFPSAVRAVVERAFPFSKAAANAGGNPKIDKTYSATVATIIELIEAIPAHLLAGEVAEVADFWIAVGELKNAVDRWKVDPSFAVKRIAGGPAGHPMTLIRDYLLQCPDNLSSPSVRAFPFLNDLPLAESIRADLTASDQALAAGQFKVATVFASAVTEALLLWACISRQPTRQAQLEKMTLGELIDVALIEQLIDQGIKDVAGQARDFRNLIHPGKAQRTRAICNLGTAHVARGAVELVATSLANKFP